MELDLQELFQVYIVEAEECLASLEQGLVKLEQRPDDVALVDEIFRAAHTLKGNSSSLGFQSLAQFGHEIEELLERVRKGEQHPDGELISLLLRAVDILNRWLPSLESGVDRPMSGDQLDVHAELRRFGRTSVSASGPGAGSDPTRDAADMGAATSSTARRTMRVEAGRMDALLDLVGEISVSAERIRRRIELLPDALRPEALDAVEDQERLLRDLYENVMRSRMVPVGPTFRRHLRTVRDVARATGKQVQLVLEGEETEVDMTVVEALSDPLVHMIRNAIDHGIELPNTRVAAGKSAMGTITLRACHDRGEIVVQISDDGAGVRRDRIRARAARTGIHAEAMSDRELLELIFQPGFTTSDVVTDTSGRGVGMDVVRRNIERVRGQIFIESGEGTGTVVSMRLPLTLAVIPGFGVGVGGESFVIPMSAVEECLEQAPPDASQATGVLHVRGDAVPYVRLRHFLGFAGRAESREVVVVVQHQQRRAGLVVDEIHGESQTVIKPLGPLLRGLPGVTGTAVMGSGAVAMVLDAGAMFRELERNEADVA
jgi:two-component system, chemotaxis family, sensor kinase CheA